MLTLTLYMIKLLNLRNLHNLRKHDTIAQKGTKKDEKNKET